jgi:hypothetical protein
MKVPFSYAFQENPNGSCTPKMQIHVNGITMGPGVSVRGGVSFGGFDIAKYRGKDLDIE